MIRTILSHNVETAKAIIRFEHEGVTIEDQFDLVMAMPGTKYLMEAQGMTSLPEEAQQSIIDYLEQSYTRQIEMGLAQGPLPVPEAPADEGQLVLPFHDEQPELPL